VPCSSSSSSSAVLLLDERRSVFGFEGFLPLGVDSFLPLVAFGFDFGLVGVLVSRSVAEFFFDLFFGRVSSTSSSTEL